MEQLTDEQWLEAAQAKFSYPNAIVPCFYTAEAWARRRSELAASYLTGGLPWQEGDLNREKTKANLASMGLDVKGL